MLARIARIIPRRFFASLNRPAPPPLPRHQQREFERLQRASTQPDSEAELALHPDARAPLRPDFEGDINPLTGEQGGPKQEPVRKWGGESEGDWSFKGRVSDF
ncbi:Protein fmp21, mitochondrial [Termitomyces sp. J132]|nr:hypothetical protein C0989_010676 [Termitomyces sp. Mn162]KAH0589055.1 hypothetical protein H2248_004827 [Termitomyces sp. 'cryptogamus']KNZ72812.1 Protein fmp21, mitochondrial [Termitomyces sp. J132]